MKVTIKNPLDGNAFSIMAAIRRVLKEMGQASKIDQYLKDAMSGDYEHLLKVSKEFANFTIQGKESEEEWEEDESEEEG